MESDLVTGFWFEFLFVFANTWLAQNLDADIVYNAEHFILHFFINAVPLENHGDSQSNF